MISVAVNLHRGLLALLLAAWFLTGVAAAANGELEALLDDDFDDAGKVEVYDPLEPVNRLFFTFNDRVYFWVVKPVATVYSAVLADEAVRGCISAAFHNVLAPVRVVNTLLQGKFRQSGTEVARFAINTLLGAGGLGDPAAEEFGLNKADEDLGQTLGFYGVGQGLYICWPFLGPSTARDTVGMAGDYFLNPLGYILAGEPRTSAGLTALKIENAASLHGKEYEALVGDAFDPYISIRDIYYQHRQSLVAAGPSGDSGPAATAARAAAYPECPVPGGQVVFDNLAGARKYEQCLINAGAQASVNRSRRQGRAMYLVVSDGPATPDHRLAAMTDGPEHHEQK